MIDIVIISNAVLQMNIVVNGSNNIFLCDMLRNQLVDIALYSLFDLLFASGFFQYLFQRRIIY